MAGQRIKYKDHVKDGMLISRRTFISTTTGASYKVVLDLNEMKYKIRNERTKVFSVISKEYGNLNVLKRTARAHLEKLGVQLKRESRQRTFGRCNKGYTQADWERDNKWFGKEKATEPYDID